MVINLKKVCVVAINSKFAHSSLAVRYFREFSGCEIFECSINDDIFSVFSKLNEKDFEVLCFSTYIWNIEYALRLASMIKSTRESVIIFGGPEAGYNSKNVLQQNSFIDGVVIGEGEYAIKALCEGKDFEEIPNLVHRNGENQVAFVDLSLLKFPYRKEDLKELENRIIYFETSRGCIFNCSYCLSSSQGKTRFFDMEYVKKGIDFFVENNVRLVKFVDRTFNENDDRACEILEYIIKSTKGTHFHFEIAPQLLSDRFISLLEKASDFVQVEAGIQTTNFETMKAISRVYDLEKVKERIMKIPKKVHLHTDLIAGLPYETYETFKAGFDYAYSMKPDMLQLGFLKLLHNTRLKNEADKYGIVTTNFAPYEVLATNTLPKEEIIKLKRCENAVDRIYNSKAFENTLTLIEKPFETFEEIGEKLWQKEKEAPLSKTALYVFLYEYFGEKSKLMLVKDFLQNNEKTTLPEGLKETVEKDVFRDFCQREEYMGKRIRVEKVDDCYLILCEKDIKVFPIR